MTLDRATGELTALPYEDALILAAAQKRVPPTALGAFLTIASEQFPTDVALQRLDQAIEGTGWTFDGLRRLYVNGEPSSWIARLCNSAAVTWTGEMRGYVPLVVGEGPTMHDAIETALRKFRAETSPST